jgi:hypothetical protein
MKECLIIKTSLRIKELENMLGLVQKLENNTGNDHQHSEKIAIAESLKSKEEAKSTHIPTCEDNYKLCKDNTEIANSIHWASEASASCKRAAEKNAIATVDWGGWFQPNFGTFYKGDTGVKEDYMIFVDDVAKYKNAFNVDLKKTTTCKYNFKTKQVDYIDISP